MGIPGDAVGRDVGGDGQRAHHEHRLDRIQFCAGVVPKFGGDKPGYIAAVAIDIDLTHPFLLANDLDLIA